MQNIIDQIFLLLKASLDATIRTYYQGNPLNLLKSNLPIVYVEAVGSDTQIGATGIDNVTHTITIGLIYDRRAELGKDDLSNIGNKTMIEIMEGRQSNGQYQTNSIAGIVRKNFTLNNSINNQILSLKYGLSNKGDVIYDEARITFRITEYVPVPSRL